MITNNWNKLITGITLFVFTSTNIVYGLPAVGIEVMPTRETPTYLNIAIPPELAKVEEIYEAPPKVDPNLIVHVQDAHGNYDAQIKIKKLLHHLYETYGFRVFFVEGAVEKLNADYIRLFPTNQHNLEVADLMAKEGKLTGMEFFMIDAPPGVEAYGIEHAELYRENFEAFKSVLSKRQESDLFLGSVDQRLSNLSTTMFNTDLRRLVMEWKKFEAGHRAFLPYVKRLSQDARKFLDVNLRSLYAQVEWPQVSRLLLLQSMEKDLDLEAGKKEKEQVVKFLRQHNLSPELIEAIEKLEERHIRMNRLEPEDKRLENLPRYLIERLTQEAAPKGFNFLDYPDFSLYAGYFILKSEVDSRALFTEIGLLFKRIIDSMAGTDNEKILIQLYRDLVALEKLYALELTREGWDNFLKRKALNQPETLLKRIQKLSPHKEALKVSEEALQGFDSAMHFYNLARQRETVFYYMVKQGMFKEAEDKSTLLTGGFHTAGVFERFREDETNYGILMPKIQGEINRQTYINHMLGSDTDAFKASTLYQQVIAGHSNDVLRALGKNPVNAVRDLVSAGVEWNKKQAGIRRY